MVKYAHQQFSRAQSDAMSKTAKFSVDNDFKTEKSNSHF